MHSLIRKSSNWVGENEELSAFYKIFNFDCNNQPSSMPGFTLPTSKAIKAKEIFNLETGVQLGAGNKALFSLF